MEDMITTFCDKVFGDALRAIFVPINNLLNQVPDGVKLHSRVANGSRHEERPLHAPDGVVHADAAILLHQHFVDPV